jgi:hypothetical protein
MENDFNPAKVIGVFNCDGGNRLILMDEDDGPGMVFWLDGPENSVKVSMSADQVNDLMMMLLMKNERAKKPPHAGSEFSA